MTIYSLLGVLSMKKLILLTAFAVSLYSSSILARVETPEDLLVRAAWHGDVAEAKRLLDAGANVNTERDYPRYGESYSGTALYNAAKRGHKAVVELLLSNGADVNFDHVCRQSTPLIAAVDNACIASCYDEEDVSAQEKKELVEIVELLLQHGADINAQDENSYYYYAQGYSQGYTALFYASAYDHKELVELLLAHGADISVKNKSGETALHIASREGHKEMVDWLLRHGADINAADQWDYTALDTASRAGQKEIVELLLQRGGMSKDRATALHEASYKGCFETVKLLLAHGADVNATNSYGQTALIKAASGHERNKGRKAVVELLLHSGADINARDQSWTSGFGSTALMYASEYGHEEVVKLLLDNGAKAEDDDMIIALRHAKFFGHKEVVALLLRQGAQALK